MGAEKTQKYKNKANHNSLEILCYSDLGERKWGGWRYHIETQSLRSYRKWEEKKKCECEGEREREEVESFDFVLILIKSTQSTSDDGRVSRHKPPRGFSPSLTGGAYSTPEHSKVFLHLGPHYGLSFFSTLLTFIPSFLLSAKVEWLQNFEKRAGLPLVGNPSCFAPFLMCVSCRPRLFFFSPPCSSQLKWITSSNRAQSSIKSSQSVPVWSTLFLRLTPMATMLLECEIDFQALFSSPVHVQ